MPANSSVIQKMPDKSGTRFARRSLLLIFSNLIKLFVQLAVIYIFSRVLSINEYGQYQSVWLYINILSVIGLFGLPSVLLSFPTGQLKQWVRSNRTIIAGMFFLLTILPVLYIIFFATGLTWLIRILLCIFILLQNISIIAETLAIKRQQEQRVLWVNIFYNGLYLLAHIWVLYQDVYFLIPLLYCLVVLAALKTVFFIPNGVFNSDGANRELNIGKQWFFLGLYDVVGVIFKWLDKWIILAFVSVSEFAVYFNGSYEIPVFVLILAAVGNVMVVELAKTKTIDPGRSVHLFHRSAFFLSALVLPAFCFLVFFHKEFFLFIFSNKYEAAIPVFFISIFIVPVRITNYTAALQVYHKNDIILKGALLDLLLAVLLLAIFYPLFGVQGLAAAFVISTYLQAAYYLWQTSALLNTPVLSLLPFKQLFLILLLSLTIMAGCYFIVNGLSQFYMLGAGLLSCAVLSAVLFMSLYKRKFF